LLRLGFLYFLPWSISSVMSFIIPFIVCCRIITRRKQLISPFFKKTICDRLLDGKVNYGVKKMHVKKI